MVRVYFFVFIIFSSVGVANAQNKVDETQQFVALMSQYLTLTDQAVNVAKSPDASVFLAIEGIYEIYEQRRDAPGAVKHLVRLLDQYGSNQAVRNMIRLKLRDIYKETNDAEKALEQLELIIRENAGK